MPNDVGRTVHEVLVAPLPLVLSETASAVAQAQVGLDEAAMHVQQQLDELTRQARQGLADDGEPTGLARFQLDAPWYHFPEVEVELKLSLSVEFQGRERPGGRRVFRPLITAMPHNARTQSVTNFTAEGTSRLRARIAAVPPPTRSA